MEKQRSLSERALNKARARMIEERDMHAKVAAPFDWDKAERARNKFIEMQLLNQGGSDTPHVAERHHQA